MNRRSGTGVATSASYGLGLAISAMSALSLGAAAGPAAAQETFTGDVEVRLVEVEVFVTDRKGHPLTGLQAENFSLEVDGKERAVEYFEASDPTSPTTGAQPGVEQSADPEPPLYLAVYVDRRFLQPGELDPMRPGLKRFIESSLSPEDRVLLASADADGMVVLQSYTTDHTAVLAKLEGLDGVEGAGRLSANIASIQRDLRQELGFRSVIENAGALPEIPGAEEEEGDPAGASRRARQQGNPRSHLIQIDAFTDEINGQLAAVAGQLGLLVSTLTGLPGRKQVIYLGGALPVRAPYDLFQSWREVFDRNYDDSDYFRSSDQQGDQNQRMILDATARIKRYRAGIEMFRDLSEIAATSDVTFHTVDVAGLSRSRGFFTSSADVELGRLGVGNSGGADVPQGRGTTLTMDDGLATLSASTGGRHISGTRRLDGYFAGLASDLQARYVLGFTADPAAGEPQDITVSLNKKKGDRRLRRALVRHRQFFTVKNRTVESAERTLAHLMMDTPSANPLGVSLEVGAPEARAEDWRLRLKIKVPLSELVLIPDRRSHSGKLSILATAGALGQGFAPVMQTSVPVRLANSDLLTALGREAEYELELRVPEDPGRVAVTVRDEYAPAESTVTAEVGKAEWLDGGDPAESEGASDGQGESR